MRMGCRRKQLQSNLIRQNNFKDIRQIGVIKMNQKDKKEPTFKAGSSISKSIIPINLIDYKRRVINVR